MRKMLCALLSLLILMSQLPASAEKAAAYLMAGYEESETYRTWATNLFFARMQERSGVAFDFAQSADEEAWRKVKASYLQPGARLPDVLFKADLSPAETLQMLDEGLLIDLAPLLAAAAPTLNALLAANLDALAAITLPDGRIGALPYINLAPSQNALWINTAWLEALKLDMPGTAEALEAVLLAFKTGDPNRNGKADEIPLSFMGAYDLKYLAHAYGLAANDFSLSAQDGKAVFMPGEAAFRPFVAWCRGLYEKGLLARDGFSTVDSLRRVSDAKATVTYGALFAPMPASLLPLEWLPYYAVVPPLTYQDKQVYRSIAPRALPGTFAITSACQDPARMLNWVDYLYSPEGAILASAGQEGVDYLVDGDGTWRKTPAAEGSGFLSGTTIMTGAVPPGVSSDDFDRRYADPQVRRISEQIDIVSGVARDPFPAFSLSAREVEQVAPLQNAIGRYLDESLARWIMGEWPLTDEQFTAFYEELDRLGLPRFMAFWQGVLDQQEEASR
ncbi:MAG: hypothetical protein AB9880_02275 [Christensenellales bacterium]